MKAFFVDISPHNQVLDLSHKQRLPKENRLIQQVIHAFHIHLPLGTYLAIVAACWKRAVCSLPVAGRKTHFLKYLVQVHRRK
jgi:hypothetical protein